MLLLGFIGLCATVGAKLMGATLIIGVDGDEHRLKMARTMGADVALNYRECNVVEEVLKLTGGGVDVAIEALGTPETFESCLRCLRPGGTLSSLGVYSGKLQIPYEAYAAGLGDRHLPLGFKRWIESWLTPAMDGSFSFIALFDANRSTAHAASARYSLREMSAVGARRPPQPKGSNFSGYEISGLALLAFDGAEQDGGGQT